MKKIWKNYKHLIMRILNLALLAGVCVTYNHVATVRAQKASELNASAATGRNYKDGSYQGTGNGFDGTIVVKVTVQSGTISDIEIVEAKSEDAAYLDNAKKIINTMIQNQTSNVDVASGATYSSNGIIEAVQNALKEAS